MSTTAVEYVCPGERYAVTRAVHLARLEAGYAACRDCPLNETMCGSERAAAASRGTGVRRLFVTDGVRGVFRNEVDEHVATRLADAFARMLWEEAGSASSDGFPVVVGHDDRVWSLSLAAAAGSALRRSGCETIDVGQVTGPEFRFAVAHLGAAGGILATGAGGGPESAGLDFVAAGRPLSLGGALDRIASLCETPIGRQTRRAGSRREFPIGETYEAALLPLAAPATSTAVVAASRSALVRSRCERLWSGRNLKCVPLPRRSFVGGSDDAALARLGGVVRGERAGFGLWIDEDGSRVRVTDESGRVVPDERLAGLLLADLLRERPDAVVVTDWGMAEQLGVSSLRRDQLILGNGTAEAMAVSMRDHRADAGFDSAGRCWLAGPSPTPDAIPVLARLLRIVGAAGTTLSALVRETRAWG